MKSQKNKAAQALGRRGGKAKTIAKAAAARNNGKKGGRPRRYSLQEIERAMQGTNIYEFEWLLIKKNLCKFETTPNQ